MQLPEFYPIEGITELVIIDYFFSINQENFTSDRDLARIIEKFGNPPQWKKEPGSPYLF